MVTTGAAGRQSVQSGNLVFEETHAPFRGRGYGPSAGLNANDIRKIDVHAVRACVAIRRDLASQALQRLRDGKIKRRKLRVRPLVTLLA